MFNRELFRALRKDAGLSQRQLAIAANLDHSWVSRLEAGTLSLIDYPKIQRASFALDVSPALFFTSSVPATTQQDPEEVSL